MTAYPTNLAWLAGYNAYNFGQNRGANPYDEPAAVQAWLDGWRRAELDAQPAKE